jgi:DNA-binding MarR family transcriptional regulator
MAKSLVIQTAFKSGLSGLRVLLVLSAVSYDSTTCTALSKLASMARMDRHTFKDHMDRLVLDNFVREHAQSRSKC